MAKIGKIQDFDEILTKYAFLTNEKWHFRWQNPSEPNNAAMHNLE